MHIIEIYDSAQKKHVTHPHQQELIDKLKAANERIAALEVDHIPNQDWIAICGERRMYNGRIENMRVLVAKVEAENSALKERIKAVERALFIAQEKYVNDMIERDTDQGRWEPKEKYGTQRALLINPQPRRESQ